jgi:hypothetical protein
VGNLNFTGNAAFSWYCVLLMVGGIAMLVLAVLRAQKTPRRVLRTIVGIGYFGYGFYLAFIFGGGHYLVFFQALILPVLLIIDAVRGNSARRRVRAAGQAPGSGGLAP